MIENFSDFINKKTQQHIFENVVTTSVTDEGVILDSKDRIELEKSKEPKIRMVSDDKILSKMTIYVLNYLRKHIKNDLFFVDPFMLEIDGKDCSMICSKSNTMFFVIYREGINKVITYFTKNPVGVGIAKSEHSVSTSRFGITQALQTLIDIFELDNDGRINEEIAPPIDDPTISWNRIYQRLYNESKHENLILPDYMSKFIKLYNTHTPNQINTKYLRNKDENSEYIQKIRYAMTGKTTWDGFSDSVGRRFAIAIHLLICGTTGVADASLAKRMRENLWFFGAGESGEVAIGSEEGKGYFVKECKAVIDKKVDELQYKMDSESACAEAICRYIKSNGKDDIPMRREMGEHRGLLITGVAGVGKSYNLDKYVEENLAEGVDYIRFGNQTTGARQMYKDLCQHNNMLLIFDDTPEMFNTEQKIALWKNAMEDQEKKRVLRCPDGSAKDSSSIYYPTTDPLFTRQDQYYREIGKFTAQERESWIEKRKKEILKTYIKDKKRMKDEEIKYFDSLSELRAERDFKKYEKNEAITLLPDSFVFNGIIVYISNQTLATFMKNARDHWDALDRRMESIDISPTRKILWYWLRRKIVSDMNDETIQNDLKILPVTSEELPDYNLNDLLTYIDDIIDGKYNTDREIYGKIEWGSIKSFRSYILFGQPNWKKKILENMRIDMLRDK